MNKTYLIKLLLPFTTMLLLFSIACDYTPATAPEAEAPVAALVVSADEINWVSWKPEVVEQVNSQRLSLFKGGKKGKNNDDGTFGSDSKWIEASKGGTVGSEKLTLGNKVRIVKDALREDEEVSVRLIFDDDELINGFGEFDFEVDNGHYSFEKDVKITLSYKYLDLDGIDPADLSVWWVDDEGTGWVEIEDLELNEKRKTVSFWIDHFTRYGWAY